MDGSTSASSRRARTRTSRRRCTSTRRTSKKEQMYAAQLEFGSPGRRPDQGQRRQRQGGDAEVAGQAKPEGPAATRTGLVPPKKLLSERLAAAIEPEPNSG